MGRATEILGDLFPELLTDTLSGSPRRNNRAHGASRAATFPPRSGAGMHPTDKQATRAHLAAYHGGAAQAADRGTHAHECASGGGGNPTSSDGGTRSTPFTAADAATSHLGFNTKFAVLLPERSRSILPPDLHVRRFVHATTFDAYLRVWSQAGFEIQFDDPHCACIVGLPIATARS